MARSEVKRVIDIDEFNTTKICCCCRDGNKTMGLLKVSVIDINAAKNIQFLTECEYNNAPRPAIFCRSTTSES